MNDQTPISPAASANGAIEVTTADLPLHCPTKAVALWASHPRVFLDIALTGHAACPYCGTRYTLQGGAILHHH